MRYRLAVLLLSMSCAASANDSDASCADDAVARAAPLLTFHFGESDLVSTEKSAKELPSLRNPADPKQKFKVYEVWGFIYKGEYRMRFIYNASPISGCTLVGQEILEHAKI